MRSALLLTALGAACWAGAAYGTWKLNTARSTFAGDTQPRSFTIRIEPRGKGEVFTLGRIEADGRAISSSIMQPLRPPLGIREAIKENLHVNSQ
jgi:hypothetical protein